MCFENRITGAFLLLSTRAQCIWKMMSNIQGETLKNPMADDEGAIRNETRNIKNKIKEKRKMKVRDIDRDILELPWVLHIGRGKGEKRGEKKVG